MSQENQITLRGYVTAEPKFRQTPAGTPVTEIRVGSTPRRINRQTGEWEDGVTCYYVVKAWRGLAINASSSLHKGDMIIVRGRFTLHQWVDDSQQPRSRVEIDADSLGHDLAFGWSHFLRGTRPQAESRDAAPDGGEGARLGLPSGTAVDGEPGDGDEPYFGPAEPPADSGWDALAEELPTTHSESVRGGTADDDDEPGVRGVTDEEGSAMVPAGVG